MVTAQHREMLDQVLEIFQLRPDYDLNIMKNSQTLTDITASVLKELNPVLTESKTRYCFGTWRYYNYASSFNISFYHQIKIGHVEAGLRTWNKYSPFPEEMNRQLTDVLSDIYFAPTQQSKRKFTIWKSFRKKIYL